MVHRSVNSESCFICGIGQLTGVAQDDYLENNSSKNVGVSMAITWRASESKSYWRFE
jgi:hypothetical protein